MPYAIVKQGDGSYAVISANGRVHAKHTTRRRAEAQVRLLKDKEKTSV